MTVAGGPAWMPGIDSAMPRREANPKEAARSSKALAGAAKEGGSTR